MDNLETPEQLNVDDLTRVDYKGTGSEAQDYYLAQRFALLTADPHKYTDAIQANLDFIQSQDGEEVRQTMLDTALAVRQKTEQARLDILAQDQVVGTPATTIDEAADIAKEEPKAKTENELFVDAVIEHVNQLPPGSLEREVARQDALKGMVTIRLQQLGIDPDPHFSDVVGAMIPGRNIFDLGTGANFEEQVQKFNMLKEDEQFRQWFDVIDSVIHGTDNAILRAERIAPFINPSDIDKVKQALLFDVFDVATLAPWFKILSLAKHGGTPIKLMRDIGKTREAAAVVDNVAKGGVDPKLVGMTKDDAILSSSPFSSEGIDPRLVEGLSVEQQAILNKELIDSSDLTRPLHDDTMLNRRFWDPDAVKASIDKWSKKFAGKARVVKEDADGVLWEVQVVKREEVLANRDNLHSRIEKLEAQLVGMTDIDLPTMRANPGGFDKTQVRDLQKRILATKQELSNLKQIRELDQELDTLTVRLTSSRHNNPVDATNQTTKELLDSIAKTKKFRAQVVKKIKTPVVETPSVETRYVKFSEDEAGKFHATELPLNVSGKLNSPSTYMAKLQPGLVAAARNIGFSQEQVNEVFNSAYQGALKGISNSGRKNLDKILLKGDMDQVVYTASQLADGVRTDEGLIQLKTTEELASYYKIRKLSDELFMLKNREVRRKLELQNFKALDLGDSIGYSRPEGKAVGTSAKRIFDLRQGKIIDTRKLADDEGIYRLRKPYEGKGEEVNYVIARESDFKELPTKVLEYRPGYIPKLQKNIFFIGELVGKRMVDGEVLVNGRKVIRFFDNPADAKTWTDQMLAKGARVETKTATQWFSENPGQLENWEEAAFGGLYEGKRTDGRVPFNLTNDEAERVGAIESLEAYMNHLSQRLPLTDFRVMLVRRFENSAKDPITGESWLNRSGDWRDPLAMDKNHPSYAGMKAAQDWVKAQLSVPSTEERMWERVAHNISRIISKTPIIGGPRTSAVALKIGTADLTGYMKTIAFHATLGAFSPRQLVVQGMGFSTAFALDPLGAPRNLAKYFALRTALEMKAPSALVAVARAAGEDATELQLMKSAYARTGLHQSVRSTGDYGIATGLYPSAFNLKYLADKGLLFFREGERFVRGYAWVQAWNKLYRKGMVITDKFIDDVTNESIRYTLDLNRANKARWQSGIFSIPTQFMQITTKFLENLLYSGKGLEAGWTAGEKVRILAANAALFGAAGIPFGQHMIENAASWIKDDSDFGLGIKDPEVARALTGGLVEWAVTGITGVTPDISNNLAIPNGLEQIFDNLFNQDKTVLEITAGVFGEIPNRGYQAASQLIPLYAAVLEDPDSLDFQVLIDTTSDLAEIFSSYRSVRKAYMWDRANAQLTRKGEQVAPLAENEQKAIFLFGVFGFSSKDVSKYYDLKKYNQEQEAKIRESADAWFKIIARYQGSPALASEAGQTRLRNMIAFTVSDLTPDEKEEVAKRISAKLAKDDYLLTRETLKAIDNMMRSEGDTTGINTNTLLLPKQAQ